MGEREAVAVRVRPDLNIKPHILLIFRRAISGHRCIRPTSNTPITLQLQFHHSLALFFPSFPQERYTQPIHTYQETIKCHNQKSFTGKFKRIHHWIKSLNYHCWTIIVGRLLCEVLIDVIVANVTVNDVVVSDDHKGLLQQQSPKI